MKFKFIGEVGPHASALRIAGLSVHRGATVEAVTDEQIEALAAHPDFVGEGEAPKKRRRKAD